MADSTIAAITDRELDERFRPVFERIADGAVEREKHRIQPFEQISWLRESGFTRLTVPVEFGGLGASVTQLFRQLIALAEADSNLPQVLRAHFSLIEQLSTIVSGDRARTLLEAAGQGRIFGNASHERTKAKVGTYATTATANADGTWTLNGRKSYSTGSLFADEIFVPASVGDETRTLIVPVGAPGVELVDDWDGFGQKMTGSGTTIFTDVLVADDHVLERWSDAQTHLSGFVQLVLLAVLAGIGRAAVRDAAAFVRTRTRVYSHGQATTAQDDPLIQQVVGRLAADSFAAESTVLAAAAGVEAAHDALVAQSEDHLAVIERAELLTVQAQLTVIDLVLRITAQLFEVGGASATSVSRQLDRHWRNARTVSSHNPAIYQARAIGDYLVNGTSLLYFWATGETSKNDTKAVTQ